MRGENSIAAPLPSSTAKAPRLAALDALRGLIMVIMAIDHASMFIARAHSTEFWGTALPVYPDWFWFMTRWITHICAPGFFFLMGMGMTLFTDSRREAGWQTYRIIGFFLIRGLILIAVQLLLENSAWMTGDSFALPGAEIYRGGPLPGGGEGGVLYLGVLFALGGTMTLLAFMVRTSSLIIGAISLIAVVASQLVIPGHDQVKTLYSPLLRLLFIPGRTDTLIVFYPIIPWLGVTGLGLLFGRYLKQGISPFTRLAALSGVGLLLLFFAVRLTGGFGNLNDVPPGLTGFLNVVKYPPSLSFLALTLGMDLLILAGLIKAGLPHPARFNPLLVFGRSPLFFYVCHLWLYALLGYFFPRGAGLAAMYGIWLTGLIILYPLCLGYNRFKSSRPAASLWRFF